MNQINRIEGIEKTKLLYEGKAKSIYGTSSEEYLIQHFRDDITAFNKEKHEILESKGILNAEISRIIFNKLSKYNIPNHFVKQVNDREQIIYKTEPIPLEVIIRNYAAGSIVKKYGVEVNKKFSSPLIEFSYKNDEQGDPLISCEQIIAFEILNEEDIQKLFDIATKINHILIEIFQKCSITLIDFKIEFGRIGNKIYLIDEISPDSCRLIDQNTGEIMDKDRFRKNMGSIMEYYHEILNRINDNFKIKDT